MGTDYTELPDRRPEHLTVSAPVSPPPPPIEEASRDPRFRAPMERFLPETRRVRARIIIFVLIVLGVFLSFYPTRGR